MLPSIDDAPIAVTLEIPPAGQSEPDALMLPSSGGVAIFENHQGGAVFIGVTGNLRELVRRRLLAPAHDAPRTWHTDYRAITARVRAIGASSSLEAEAIYLHHAQARMPLAYATVIERWRSWFVQVDPGSVHPEWGKTSTPWASPDPARPRQASKGTLAGSKQATAKSMITCGPITLGPIRDKDAAGRMIELTIDGFDLCRYPNLLAQSPHAAACAYKDMGRCPAPCDGSESLASYRARVEEAARAIGAGTRQGMRAVFEARMQDAAAAQDFEHAARCKRALDRMDQLDAPATALVEDIARWRLAIITRASRARAARVLAFVGLRIVPIADVLLPDGASARAGAAAVVPALHEAARVASTCQVTKEHLNHIAAVSRFVALPAKKRRGEVLMIGDELTPSVLSAALARIARVREDEAHADIEDQSVEAM